MEDERWKRNWFGCTGEAVKEQVCIRSGTRCRMRFFIRTHLRVQVGKGKEEIKDAAIAKVHAYISVAPSLCSIPEEEFFIKS